MSPPRPTPSPLALSLALALAFGSTLAPPAYAGLGPLRQLSAQGEPWLAEVHADALEGDAPPDIRLATRTDYDALTPPTPNAAKLAVRAQREPSGAWRITVSGPPLAADDPLHFALTLANERVRWVREYRTHGYQQRTITAGAPASAPVADLAAPAARPARYRVASGDTLSAIAWRFYPQHGARAMQAVFRANPGAFIDGDINSLRAGASLLLPATLAPVAVPAATPEAEASPPLLAAADATAPTGAQALPQSAQQQVERLQQAQARLLALEREVARQLAREAEASRVQATASSADADDASLDEMLAWYIASGSGGLAVMSLLAWRLAKRQRARAAARTQLSPETPAAAPAKIPAARVVPASPEVDAGIVAQPYLADGVPMLHIDHAHTPAPALAEPDAALADLFAELGETSRAELDALRAPR